MKKSIFILTLAILGSFGLVYGQMDINPHLSSSSGYSVTNLTDYQSYGVNPANLGFESDKKFHFGLLEFSAGFYSEPLSRDKIFKDILRGNFEFGNEQKQTVIDNFSDSRVLGSAQVNLLGFSYQDEKLGGISFNIRERMSFNLILNNFTSEMLFLGYNADYFDQRTTNASGEIQGIASNPQKLSVLGDGSEANLTWTREFAVSYGRSIINKDELQLNLGGGIRYIQGFLVGQYYSYNNHLLF